MPHMKQGIISRCVYHCRAYLLIGRMILRCGPEFASRKLTIEEIPWWRLFHCTLTQTERLQMTTIRALSSMPDFAALNTVRMNDWFPIQLPQVFSLSCKSRSGFPALKPQKSPSCKNSLPLSPRAGQILTRCLHNCSPAEKCDHSRPGQPLFLQNLSGKI